MRWKLTEFTLTSQYCTYFLFNLPEEFCIYCWPWHILNERCLTEPLTLLFLPHKNDSFRTKITFFTTPLFYDDTKSFLLLYSYLPFFRSLLQSFLWRILFFLFSSKSLFFSGSKIDCYTRTYYFALAKFYCAGHANLLAYLQRDFVNFCFIFSEHFFVYFLAGLFWVQQKH